jgi:DNA-binding CsgD family transcriptional regulator
MKSRRRPGPIWKAVLGYGVLLALGAMLLAWLDYQHFVRSHADDIYVFLIALGFLALGIFVGVRVLGRRHAPLPFDANPKAQAALGISGRELDVLNEIAAGFSTKEIAARLEVSPNTVKTHTARLFEKLGVSRRTEAIHRARELGIVR